MQYTNQAKNEVKAEHPRTGKLYTVPRGHRFWQEFGIDQAEQRGEIADADPEPNNTSGS